MSQIHHYENCPFCKSNDIKAHVECVDYTVSRESFEVWQCAKCSGAFTQDIPSQESIGRYYKSEAYVSHTNTSKGFINKLYQIARKYTLPHKRHIVERHAQQIAHLLDIGAGTGHFANEMEKGGWKVTGLEPDEESRKLAQSLHGITLRDMAQLEILPNGYFEVITMWHVLEHVHQLHAMIKRLKALLKPGGTIFIAVPNYTGYDASVYGQHWAAYDVPRHLYHFSPQCMMQLLEQYGLAVRKQKPMHLDAFYVSMLSAKYSGKSLVHAFITGVTAFFKTLRRNGAASSIIYIAGHK